jgi:hypothetical protein
MRLIKEPDESGDLALRNITHIHPRAEKRRYNRVRSPSRSSASVGHCRRLSSNACSAPAPAV